MMFALSIRVRWKPPTTSQLPHVCVVRIEGNAHMLQSTVTKKDADVTHSASRRSRRSE